MFPNKSVVFVNVSMVQNHWPLNLSAIHYQYIKRAGLNFYCEVCRMRFYSEFVLTTLHVLLFFTYSKSGIQFVDNTPLPAWLICDLAMFSDQSRRTVIEGKKNVECFDNFIFCYFYMQRQSKLFSHGK